jgi:predicted Zn-dependent protease
MNVPTQKAMASQDAHDVDPGRYTVVLEPSAVSTLIGFLGWFKVSACRPNIGRTESLRRTLGVTQIRPLAL